MRLVDYYRFDDLFDPIWLVLLAVLLVIPFWKICRSSGHSGFLSILILVPVINLIFLYYLAFSNPHRSSDESVS